MKEKTSVISQQQLDLQLARCNQINQYWQQQGLTPVAYVETYGCQQNEADSEKIRGLLIESGYHHDNAILDHCVEIKRILIASINTAKRNDSK